MNKKDLLVLAHLRKNARLALTKISRKTAIPISTIHEKLKQFEDGLIIKHTSLLDFTKLGFNVRANIFFKANKEKRGELKESLLKNPNVNSLYKVNNGYDFMAEVIFRHLREVEEFVEGIEERFRIKAREVFYIIEELKREGFMADPVLIDMMEKDVSSWDNG